MQRYQNSLINTEGEAVVGATVDVFLAGTSTRPTLYSDNGVTTTPNPLTTDAQGNFFFFVADGRYDLDFSGAGITPYSVDNIEIADITQPVAAVSSTPYSAVDADRLILVNAAGGNISILLPTAVAQQRIGKVFTIKKTDSSGNTVTVTPNGAETIDGGNYMLVNQFQYVSLVGDGANWHIISNN